jgi:hypothetical protein
MDKLIKILCNFQYYLGSNYTTLPTNSVEMTKRAEEYLNNNPVKLNIDLNEYSYKCGDGCCDNYGTITTINGVELECENQDAGTIVKQILEHLGYDVTVTLSYDGDTVSEC